MTLVPPGSTPAQKLERLLRNFARQLDLSAVVVGDTNGLPVVSVSRGDRTLAATAMATMILYAAENVASNLGLEGHEDVLLEGKDWKVLVRSLGDGFTFLVVIEGQANLGLLRLEVERIIPELRALIAEMK